DGDNNSDKETPIINVPNSFAAVVQTIMPSVVYINAQSLSGSSSGSGVIMGSDGYILTNRHVVENAQSVQVVLENRDSYFATNWWMDDLSDLAVVKIKVSDLDAADFADPTSIHVGDWVVAAGHPLGISPSEGGATVTAGIVSNLGYSFTIGNIPYYDIIQTDAALNPGNSGGPLVNLEGKVIGINSAISGQAQNISYAINVNTARPVYEDLIKAAHKVTRPFLGVVMEDITPDLIRQYNLTPNSGAFISDVVPTGPAYNKIKQYDVIIEFAGLKITTVAQLITELWQHKPNETVSVKFYSGNKINETTITLVERK
ncbi:MAG: trypsin-like peptidase domain-containing protein, partial [Chloroflexi bacterium]|nr:trypsin-like peptidase domain-containing protein [Chloroflexota bacterium]